MAVTVGDDEWAKYPFLAGSGEYLRDKGFTLEQFGTDPDLKVVVSRALERVMAAASGKVYRSGMDGGSRAGDIERQIEIFSFLLAVVLLRLSGMDTLVRRFALAESRRAEAHLERDLGGGGGGGNRPPDPSKTDLAVRLIGELFSVPVSQAGGGFAISVPDYVRHAVKFHEVEWKLVNRRVSGGLVHLTRHEVIRLVRSELGDYILNRVRSAPVPDMLPHFEAPVAELVAVAKRLEPAPPPQAGADDEPPPCIKHAMAVLERGENLPHSGRFMLATFFINRGWPIDRIAPMFKGAPDYNERITMYQLRHLSGEGSSGGTKYSCPSCKKLQGQDLCFPVPACEGIFSPMQFKGEAKGDAPS